MWPWPGRLNTACSDTTASVKGSCVCNVVTTYGWARAPTFIMRIMVFRAIMTMMKYSNGEETTSRHIRYFIESLFFGIYRHNGRALMAKSIHCFCVGGKQSLVSQSGGTDTENGFNMWLTGDLTNQVHNQKQWLRTTAPSTSSMVTWTPNAQTVAQLSGADLGILRGGGGGGG